MWGAATSRYRIRFRVDGLKSTLFLVYTIFVDLNILELLVTIVTIVLLSIRYPRH